MVHQLMRFGVAYSEFLNGSFVGSESAVTTLTSAVELGDRLPCARTRRERCQLDLRAYL